MRPDITTVRTEKRQNRAQILAFAFRGSLKEGLFCRSPVVNEVVLDTGETLELFAELIRTGRAWNLGDPYLNEALNLLDAGYIMPGGKITNKGRSLVLDEGREVLDEVVSLAQGDGPQLHPAHPRRRSDKALRAAVGVRPVPRL